MLFYFYYHFVNHTGTRHAQRKERVTFVNISPLPQPLLHYFFLIFHTHGVYAVSCPTIFLYTRFSNVEMPCVFRVMRLENSSKTVLLLYRYFFFFMCESFRSYNMQCILYTLYRIFNIRRWFPWFGISYRDTTIRYWNSLRVFSSTHTRHRQLCVKYSVTSETRKY